MQDRLAGLGAAVARTLNDEAEKPLLPGLYLVATPIGNLADISLRALAVLAKADLVACEDTRHSGRLLSHFGIAAQLTPYHEHNASKARPALLAKLEKGARIAVISDAGTPLISDPGYKLVREALDAGISVTAIPGASATLAALSSAGLPTDSFFFAGFLPPKSAARKARLGELKSVPGTLLFYETASRLPAMVADLASVLGDREAALAKELTKLHETVSRGRLNALAVELSETSSLKGEYVVLAGPPGEEAEIGDADIAEALKRELATSSLRDAARSVAAALKVKRSRVYQLGLSLTGEER
ncbi:16S rRNA (cytidine(1402)-2'-O)-methyltransferase [Methyloligella sp. GL2]|nr:16S rRNA (cytidine(1402)-2'-O)-methyltransferase [Methyloligella sp. GL2]